MKFKDVKYFIYVRKSTESDGRQVLSIPAQIEEAKRLQQKENLNVLGIFSDSRSAKIPFNRPDYSEMIKQLKQGKASGIIIWKIDRLARNHLEGGEFMHLLQTGVIKSIWTPGREYKSNDSALLISLETSMATQYSVDLSQNVTRGLKSKAENGVPPHIAPQGYLNTKKPESGSNSIVVDPKRWGLIRKGFDLMLTGLYSIERIAALLNTEYNYKTRPTKERAGGPISVSMMHRVFTNQFYTGYFIYNGKTYKGKYKPMITDLEYEQVQKILGRKGKPKVKKHEFAFTGFIRCGCGCAITASRKFKQIKATGEFKSYTFYHCSKRKTSLNCGEKKYTTEAEMVALISNELKKCQLDPRYTKWALEVVNETREFQISKQQEQLQLTKAYLAKLESELDNLLELRISNLLSDTRYLEKKSEREATVLRVKEKFNRIQNSINTDLENLDEKLVFTQEAIFRFETGTLSYQKEICGLIGWNWELKGKKISFTKPFWLTQLEVIKNHFEKEKEALELIKTFTEYKQTASYKELYSYMSCYRDNIRTDVGEL